MFKEVTGSNFFDNFINHIKEATKDIESLTVEEKTDTVMKEAKLPENRLLTKDEVVSFSRDKIHAILGERDADMKELYSQVEELQKTTNQFLELHRGVASKKEPLKEDGPLQGLVKKIKAGKEEAENQIRAMKEFIEPEVKKAQEMIASLEEMKKLLHDKFQGKEEKTILTLEDGINQEIEELKDELDSYYQKAMLLSQGERKTFVTSMNALVKSDTKGRFQAKTLKFFYEVGAKLNITPRELHEEILAGFELNETKNDFFEGLSDFIMSPKESVQKGTKTIRESFEEKGKNKS